MPIDQFGRPLPYTDSREVYSVPPAGGIPVNPTGFYRAQGVPYPRPPAGPTDPNRNRDLLGNVVDHAMEPDRGVGAAPPRDPFMASLPPRQPQAAPGGPVTTLTPSRTTPFSRADAQALAALDPRALQEAKDLAALPESTPAKMTATFGGRNFEMQPSARVDRNALARLYAQAQERKAQERQDVVRGQEQSHKERIVSIPGEQATKRREMELGTEERLAGKKIEAEAPIRAADIASKQAQTAAVAGAEQRAAAQAARQPSPAQEALERRLEAAKANPFKTTEQMAQIEDLERQVLAGRGVPSEQAAVAAKGAAGPAQDPITAMEGDASIQKIIEDATAKRTGWTSYLNPITGQRDRASAAAARQLATSAIRRAAQKYGMDPKEVEQYIISKIGA